MSPPICQLLYITPFSFLFLAQEFQALKIATEEKNFSWASFPKELSFIKSSQAVLAVKEMLVNICKNQWDQLSGNGDEGPILYGMPEGL